MLRAPEEALFACFVSDEDPWWASYGMGRCLLRSRTGAVREKRIPHRTGKTMYTCAFILLCLVNLNRLSTVKYVSHTPTSTCACIIIMGVVYCS